MGEVERSTVGAYEIDEENEQVYVHRLVDNQGNLFVRSLVRQASVWYIVLIMF